MVRIFKRSNNILYLEYEVEGTHYFPKERRIDWKVEQMEAWVENGEVSDKAREILARIA